MKLNDRYIKATLAGIPYLLPYGQLIADPAPATRLNDSGALLWDGILEGDSREELLALLAHRYHATEREHAGTCGRCRPVSSFPVPYGNSSCGYTRKPGR